ncbi:MAG: class II fumarate hydratase [Promethearchaeota archaeon]
MSEKFRKEKDVLGELNVPADAYWGVNTQRAILNFQISDKRFPKIFITSLAEVKKACLLANLKLNLINREIGDALLQAIKEMLEEDKFYNQFPIDVFQTGSGTQTNMNINEVLANRANQILGHPMGKKTPVHPNDHVNKGQSSNDVIPTGMHISTLHLLDEKLLLSLEKLISALDQKIKEFEGVVKVGRTHLQDAVPIPLSLEFEVYKKQIITNQQRLKNAFDEICFVAIGGTALGTGINAHPELAELVAKNLTEITGFPIKINPVKAEGIASHNSIANVSGNLKLLALSLIKMANDIRWMGSGPRAGLAELNIPPNEPGSSIMPGKINPTQSEALIQVCLQVIGNDSIITAGEAFGSILDLNVCKPIIIYNLLESIEILSGGINSFIDKCLKDLSANKEQIKSQLEKMIMIVTNLNPYIGYDKSSEIAQKAFKEGKTIKQVINEMGIEIEGDLDEILDPRKMV